jgi:four helix bundle protein
MGDFQHLKVWHKSHQLTLTIYRITRDFPSHEMYGVTSQLRRSAASVPANISEGCGRGGDAELIRFLRISLGSANELQYHLLLSRDLGYVDPQAYVEIADQVIGVRSMLANLIESLDPRSSPVTADGRR